MPPFPTLAWGMEDNKIFSQLGWVTHHSYSFWQGAEYYHWQSHQDYIIGVGEKLLLKEEKEERYVDDQQKWFQEHS